jgi:hypothetical protein
MCSNISFSNQLFRRGPHTGGGVPQGAAEEAHGLLLRPVEEGAERGARVALSHSALHMRHSLHHTTAHLPICATADGRNPHSVR